MPGKDSGSAEQPSALDLQFDGSPGAETSEAQNRPTEASKLEECFLCTPQHCHADLFGIILAITGQQECVLLSLE